jgi:hypothetical protein
MKALSSARTFTESLPDGRLRLVIEHGVLHGVTPAMLAFWFENLEGEMELEGRTFSRYVLWHPVDHDRFEVCSRAADGSSGAGARVRFVEAFGGDPAHYVGSPVDVDRCDESGVVLTKTVCGARVMRLEHAFDANGGGTHVTTTLVVGATALVARVPVNRVFVPRGFPAAMVRDWFRHNVESVGNLERILPALAAQEGT